MAKQYEMAFAIGAKLQGNFSSAFKNAGTSVRGLQTQIESLNKKQGDISSYQRTQTAIENTKKKLELYQQQYANLKAEMDKNGQASAAEQNALLAKGKAIDDLREKQAQLEAKLSTTGDALQKEGVDLNRLSDASAQTGSQIDQLKQKQAELAEASENSGSRMTKAFNDAQSLLASLGVAEGLKKIYEGFKECTEQAIAFEAEMAAVRRTTGGTEEYIKELGAAFKTISTEIPITTSELSSIATTAGQLGIAQEDVEQFTVVMAKLATTTDLTADEAATMLAQFSNITGVKDYERIGSVVAQLGDSTATTASKVVEMSQGMAAAANIAGMGSTDIMAIAAALGSLGIEAQAGSTSMSQLITTLYKATETGEKLAEFAEVAGMTADQFKRAWAEDAVGAMNSFITGLNDVERNGRSAIVILSELGITNVRQQKAILGLASAGNLLSSTIAQANTAWEQNTALDEKANIMYDTTQAKLTMMNNSFANLGIAIGDAFAPAVGTVADALNDVVQPITQFIEENPKLVQAIAAAATVIGVVTAAIAAYTIAAKLAAAASATLSAAMPWLLALTAGAAIITGLIVGLSDFSDTADHTSESVVNLKEQYDDLMSGIEEQDHIIGLCEDYKRLSKQIDHTVDTTRRFENFGDIDISLGATAEASITADDFLIDGDHSVVVTGDPDGTVDADQLLDTDGGLVTISGSPEPSVDADLLLIDDRNTVTISGEPEQSVNADDLLDEDGNVIQVEGDPIGSVDADLLLDGDENVVDLEGNPISNVNAHAFLDDDQNIVYLDGEPGEDKLSAQELVTDEPVPIVGEPDGNKLSPADLVAGRDVELSGIPGETLLNPDELVGDIPVPIAGVPDEEALVSPAELVEAGAVPVAGAPDTESLVNADELVNNYGIKLHGTPDSELILDASVLVNNSTPVLIHAQWDNMEDMQNDVEKLKQSALDAQTDLTTATQKLRDMQEYQRQLQARLKHANNQEDKDSLSSQLQLLTGKISEQEQEVSKLETSYEEAAGTYIVAASAAETLAERDAALAAIQAELGISASDASGNIDAQTESINAQIEAVEGLAEAEKNRMRGELIGNLREQTSRYLGTYTLNKSHIDNIGTLAQHEDRLSILQGVTSTAQRFLGKTYKDFNADVQSTVDALDAAIENGTVGSDEFNANLMHLRELEFISKGTYTPGTFTPDVNGWYNSQYGKDNPLNGLYLSSNTDLDQGISRAYTSEADAYSRVNSVLERRQEYINDLADAVYNGVFTFEEIEDMVVNEIVNATDIPAADIDGAELAASTMDLIRERIVAMAEEEEAAADGISVDALRIQKATEPIIDQMNELSEAYAKAYDAAYDSISGQFDLFEKVDLAEPAENAHKAVDEYIEALNSQAAYIQQYEENLRDVKEMGLSDALIEQLSDGSKESAAILANIVAGGRDKIDELNDAFEGVETGKESFADTVAEMEAGLIDSETRIKMSFTESMEYLEAQLTETVEQMSKTEEAAAAGADTMQAYADAAAGKQSAVESAFEKVAAAAARKLQLRMRLEGFAGGTRSAPEGLAMVGEEGPELVYLHGGETILNAADTQRTLDNLSLNAEPVNALSNGSGSAATYAIEYKPQYNITGAMNADELQAVLDEHDAGMRDRIEEMLDDIENDRTRRQYA